MQAITKVFSDIVKPYIDAADENLQNQLNINGVKNILNAVDSITLVTTSNTSIQVGSVDLVAGQKIVYSALQETAMASNTRNTLMIESFNSGQTWSENTALNYHLEAGVHEFEFTAPADGKYSIKVWGHTVSADTVYSKFMVCDANAYAIDDTYEPYAKSNKELTEDVQNAWFMENQGTDTVYVTADGTKTYRTLLNELAAAILSQAQNMSSGHIMKLTAFQDEGDFNWAMPLRPVIMASNASGVSASFFGASAASDESAQIKSVTVHSTFNSCYMGRTMCSTSGNTFTNFLSLVPTSGKKIHVYYKIYKKIY